jgi:hypothetical protein
VMAASRLIKGLQFSKIILKKRLRFPAMVTSFENMLAKSPNVRSRCTVDIQIMGIHYARDENFVFCCHFTRSGSLRLADWSLLISFYVSRQSHFMWRESHFMCRPMEQPAYSQLSAPPV